MGKRKSKFGQGLLFTLLPHPPTFLLLLLQCLIEPQFRGQVTQSGHVQTCKMMSPLSLGYKMGVLLASVL